MGKKTILVIDDQKETQVLLTRRLEAAGYAVEQAWDGKDGLWKVLEHKPDLILVDVIMPEMNGIEFVSRLRQIDKEKSIPVIVISKRALIVNCFDDNMIEGFFPKPFDMPALFSKIEEILKREDTFKMLSAIEEKRQKAGHLIDKYNRLKREAVCKRCAYVLTDDEELLQACPMCGYPGFLIQESVE